MEYHKGYSTMRAYYLYLKNLQKEFLDLIEFCFDDEYYPDILGKMKPYERFYIYRSLNDIPVIFDRSETFKTTAFYTHNDNIPAYFPNRAKKK